MLNTLCDKFDKIYGIIYNKNTSSDRGNLINLHGLIKIDRVIQFLLGDLFFVKKYLTSIFSYLTSQMSIFY